MLKRTNAEIILGALLLGIPCQINEMTYQLDIENELCIQAKVLTKQNGQWVHQSDTLVKTFFDLPDFIRLCDTASAHDITVIGANVALNSFGKVRSAKPE